MATPDVDSATAAGAYPLAAAEQLPAGGMAAQQLPPTSVSLPTGVSSSSSSVVYGRRLLDEVWCFVSCFQSNPTETDRLTDHHDHAAFGVPVCLSVHAHASQYDAAATLEIAV